MRPRVAVVANPRAGGSGWLGAALRRLARVGPVAVTGRIEDLAPQLRAFREDGVDLLAVVGGDGTLHAVLAAAERVWEGAPPPIFPIPAGTTGLVQQNLGAARGDDRIGGLEAIVARRRPLVPVEVPSLRVCGRTAFNVGVALPQRVAARAVGRACTAVLAARLLGSAAVDGRFARRLLSPFGGRLVVDGVQEPAASAAIVYASALGRLGPLRGWSRVEQPADGFRLLRVPTGPPSSLLARVPRFALGRGQQHVVAARRLVLAADAPFTYVADGEPYDAYGEVEVRRGPPVLLARAG